MQLVFLSVCLLRVSDPAVLQDPQAETTGRRVRIAEDVLVLRVDYVSIKSTLPGVW
jgi:hypothetical protein